MTESAMWALMAAWFAFGALGYRIYGLAKDNKRLRAQMRGWFDHAPSCTQTGIKGRVHAALAECTPVGMRASATVTLEQSLAGRQVGCETFTIHVP